MEKAGRLKRQLEQLLAQDLSEMGYEARIRHQQRVEELRDLCTAMALSILGGSNEEQPLSTSARPTRP